MPTPVDEFDAQVRVPPSTAWPRPTIGGHRIQAGGNRGARVCLMSICRYAVEIEGILTTMSSVDAAVTLLRSMRAPQISRTTSFDLALRAGQLLHRPPFGPQLAHLRGSSGPASGFDRIWGFDPRGALSNRGEAGIRRWSSDWRDIAARVGVEWQWSPFTVGDLENALCIFQDRRTYKHYGDPYA